MKFSFKQSLLLLTSTFGALLIVNSVSIINLNRTNSSNYKNIKTTARISKTITAEAQGDVALNKAINNLGYRHSEFSPTGIFVTKNSTVIIFCPEIENVYLVVGQWGKYQNLNDGKELAPQQIALKSGQTIFQPEQDGVLYISNKNADVDIKLFVDVVNGIEIPTFNVDQTTSAEFNQKLNKTSSPFVELIGKNFFGTFQIALANRLWKDNLPAIEKINDTIKNWDEIYEMSNYVSGLSLNYDGVAKKHHNLVHITNPDTGGGYASATNYFIRFQQATGAGKALFGEKYDQWGLWHETGHTYQNQDYTFDGFGEVTVNINSFWIQEEQGYRNRLFGDKNNIKKIKEHINSTDPNKVITDLNLWGRLGMFLQLHMGYGKEFYPRLNQEYRLLSASEKPRTNAEKYQTFIKVTSKTVNRNLIPFFEKWGIHANDDTKNVVANYPKLTAEIWNNIFDDHIEDKAIIDYQLDKYNPLSGVQVKANEILNLNVGDKIDETAAKNTLENVASDMTLGEVSGPDWNGINWNNKTNINYATVSVSQPGKMSNKYLVPTKVTAYNSIKI